MVLKAIGEVREDVLLNMSKSDTYELFSMLLGHAIFNHQRIVSEARRVNWCQRDTIETWKYGKPRRGILSVSSVQWNDPLELFTNTLSDSDFYNYFEAILRGWHGIQFRLAEKPRGFEQFPDLLIKNLREENTLRNHLVHSEYTWHPELLQNEEIKLARPQTSSGAKNHGHFQIKTLKREDFLQFIEYQTVLREYLQKVNYSLDILFYDDFYIAENRSKFDVDIIRFAESEEVSPAHAIGRDEEGDFEDASFLRHHEIVAYLEKITNELRDIDRMRLSLNLKSSNYEYLRQPPIEGSILDYSNLFFVEE